MGNSVIYKLNLDSDIDNDLIGWLDSLPRNRKSEVVRHALRYYIQDIKDGETFKMNSASKMIGSAQVVKSEIAETETENSNSVESVIPNINKKPILKGVGDIR